MSVLPIITVGEAAELAILKRPSEQVTVVDDAVRALLDDMLETMYAAPGIGLAAVQVGVLKRLVVMDVAREGEPPQPRKYVNPKVVWASDETSVYEEGCLSIPDIYDEVERPAKVRFTYLDETGAPHEEEAEGLYATCIQHEIDHCDGVLFLDHLSRLKRDRGIAKVKKAKKAMA
ncbi:peptide deformylase [soil metagenome]